MSGTLTSPVPGWYEDPLSPSSLRWWDGKAWTGHVRETVSIGATQGTQATQPTHAAPVTQSTTERSDDGGPDDGSGGDYVPMRGYGASVDRGSPPTARGWLRPVHWSAPSVWVLSFTPWIFDLVTLSLGILVALRVPIYLVVGALFLPLLISIALAVRDRNRLAGYGYDKRASWAWVLLSPLAYLIVRGIRVHRVIGKGLAPLWILLLNLVLVVGANLVGSYFLQAALVPQRVHQIESSIASAYAAHGNPITVACPTAGVSLLPGTSFVCTATDASGSTGSITVRILSADRWSFSQIGPSPVDPSSSGA